MKRNFILYLFLTVFAMYIGTANVSAQSADVTVLYTGFEACGGCTVCGSDYWCFNTTGSYCGNTPPCSTKAFTDPVPPGNIVTGITIEYWSAHCSGGTITASIDGNVFPTVNETSTGCLCSSSPCSMTATANIIFPCGVPGYIYGGTDSIQICTGANVCMTRLEITMTYAPADESMPPPPPGAISGNNVVCQNTAQTYSVPVDSGASTYTWRVPPDWTILAGQGTNTVSVLPGASSGKVCVTPSNLCGTADTACFNVSFVTAQNDLPILMDDDTLFSPYLQPDYWYVTGNPVPIDSGAYYIFTQTGDYYVKGVDTTGCVASSDTASVIVTGVHSYAEKQQIKIYPNPANDVITIESPFFKQAQVISVCDVQGQLISSINTNAKKTNVDISALSKGVYIVEVKTVNGFLVKKLIKE